MGARTLSLLAMALLMMAACATAGGGGGASSSRNLITAKEIASINAQTAYDAVDRLQPSWLNTGRYVVAGRGDRPTRTPTVADESTPHIYVGDVNVGGLNYLRSIKATDVQEMRHYYAVQATRQFGTGHPGGVIRLILK